MLLTRRQAVSIVLIFLITRIFVTAVGTLAVMYLPSTEGEEYTHLLDGGPALDMWYRWDAGFYATIATEGYDWMREGRSSDDMSFLPLYPLLIRGFMDVSQCGFTPYLSTCATVGGLLISNLALLVASFLLFDLAQRYANAALAWRALWLLMLSPGSVFFSGVYTESLFLLLSLLTFWLLAKDRFVLAVLAASLAALTRSTGIALVPALLWVAWRGYFTPDPRWLRGKRGNDAPPDEDASMMNPRRANSFALSNSESPSLPVVGVGSKVARLLVALLPLALYSAYVFGAGNSVGDPLAFFHTYNTTWHRSTGSVIGAFMIYFSGEDVSLFGWELSWIDLLATLGYLALAVVTLRKKVAWGLYAGAATFMPAWSGLLISMPRYGTAIFPFYIVLAEWARRWWQKALLYGISIALMIFITYRFVTWKWIA